MKKVMLFALISGCGLMLLGCGGDGEESGGNGECPAMFHVVVGSVEVSCDDAATDYQAGEDYLSLEVEGEGSNGAAALAVYEGGEEVEAIVLWEAAGSEGEQNLATYSYTIDDSTDLISGTLTGTLEDGTEVSACWVDLPNVTL